MTKVSRVFKRKENLGMIQVEVVFKDLELYFMKDWNIDHRERSWTPDHVHVTSPLVSKSFSSSFDLHLISPNTCSARPAWELKIVFQFDHQIFLPSPPLTNQSNWAVDWEGTVTPAPQIQGPNNKSLVSLNWSAVVSGAFILSLGENLFLSRPSSFIKPVSHFHNHHHLSDRSFCDRHHQCNCQNFFKASLISVELTL